MKNKILDSLAIIIGLIFVAAFVTCPVALVHHIWTGSELSLKVGLTTLVIWVCYYFAIKIKK